MSDQNTAAFKWSNIKSLFGPPPVFSTESEPAYDEIMIRVMESLQPRDFIEIILIKQAGDATWDGIRYLRHKSLGVEQRYLRSLELKARQLKDAQENKEVREVVAKVAQSADELERVADLEIAEDSMRHQIIKVLRHQQSDLEFAQAFEKGLEYQQVLEGLINLAYRRRDDALDQLERYRTGLGQAASSIIDAEFRETCVSEPIGLVPDSASGVTGDAPPEKGGSESDLLTNTDG